MIWWLADRQFFIFAFKNWTLPGSIVIPVWVWPLLGVIFLPWTTLAYLILYPGGIIGYVWIVLGAAFLLDLAGHVGSYQSRNRFPAARRSQTT